MRASCDGVAAGGVPPRAAAVRVGVPVGDRSGVRLLMRRGVPRGRARAPPLERFGESSIVGHVARWQDGSRPHDFVWVIAGQLAVCERLGGVGDAHRKVRRQQELRWLANQGVASVLAVCADSPPFGDYDRAGIAWMHRPLTAGPVGDVYAGLGGLGKPVGGHGNTGNGAVVGFLAGGLRLRGPGPAVVGPQPAPRRARCFPRIV